MNFFSIMIISLLILFLYAVRIYELVFGMLVLLFLYFGGQVIDRLSQISESLKNIEQNIAIEKNSNRTKSEGSNEQQTRPGINLINICRYFRYLF